MNKQLQSDIAVANVRKARQSVRRLARQVDPGHVQMIKYLERTASKLERIATDLQARIDEESGV